MYVCLASLFRSDGFILGDVSHHPDREPPLVPWAPSPIPGVPRSAPGAKAFPTEMQAVHIDPKVLEIEASVAITAHPGRGRDTPRWRHQLDSRLARWPPSFDIEIENFRTGSSSLPGGRNARRKRVSHDGLR